MLFRSTSGKPANHTHRDCWVFKQSGRLNAEHKGLDTPSEDDDEPHKQSAGKQKNFPQEIKIVNSLQVITRKNRAAPTKICAARSTPEESRNWMSKPITFDHQDYSRSIRNTGWTALILDPIIDGLQFTQVLMDGGSDINLLYQDSIRRMGIDPTKIRHSNTSFKGVMPGPYAHCTGSLPLEVVFGSSNNLRREKPTSISPHLTVALKHYWDAKLSPALTQYHITRLLRFKCPVHAA